jgi:hypothetical protein
MKMKYLLPVVFAAAALAFNFNALADDGETNDECHIDGGEVMDAVIVLNATSNAPAGATGIAKIDSENEDGAEAASLDLKMVGLDPGDYDLSITLQSTGTNIDLGVFTASSGHEGDDDGEGDQGDNNQGENEDSMRLDWQGGGQWISCCWGGFTNWGSWTNWSNTNFCNGTNFPVITRIETTLPAGVNPTDIAQLTVSDTNGNAILVGDLVTPAPATVINISATVHVTPGIAAPSASGIAQVQSTAAKGKWKHQFNLVAGGINAKSNLKMNVNGKNSGAARSSKTGQVTIKKLPSHTPALRSLRLLDAQGNEAASAKF